MICSTIQKTYGSKAKVYLFGSRTDDSAKGGDIDLLVCATGSNSSIMNKIKTISLLQMSLGDQKIDLVVTFSLKDSRSVVKEALTKGILL